MANRLRLHTLAQTTGGTHRFVKGALDLSDLQTLLKSSNRDDVLGVLRRITDTVEEIPPEHRRRVAAVLNGMLGDADEEVRRMAHLAMSAITEFPDNG